MSAATDRALELVACERLRQDRLKAAGKFEYGCDDMELSDGEFLIVLVEETGEVARCYAEAIGRPHQLDRQALLAELSQVAACCVGRMELLMRQVEEMPDPETETTWTDTTDMYNQQALQRIAQGL